MPLPLLLVPALLAQAPAPAVSLETPLSAAERTQALDLLQDAQARFLKATEGLSPAQLAWKPAPDRWSVAECSEHITVVEGLLADGIVAKLLAAPRDPSKRAEIKFLDAQLITMLQDRSHKVQAPESIQPKARFATRQEMLAAFGKAHASLEEALRGSTADWRARTMPHPFFGTLDAYQWVLLAAGHTLRHVQQIDEVKGLPGFPGK
jgi:hypothetical protein